MDWTKPPHDWSGLWVLNDGPGSGITLIVWACRGLVWLEPLQNGNSDVTGEKNEPVFGPYRTAVHQNGTIEQHFAGALAEASPWRRKFEMANCRS
jgi:hypothetical protein